jgi:transcriptional regulator with GAF, ATPase, and Fis domain
MPARSYTRRRVTAKDEPPSRMMPTQRMADELVVRRRPGRTFLAVMDGVDKGKDTKTLGARVTGGRSAVNDLVLTDSSVSGTHFELVLTPAGILLRDLDSTNGTHIGGIRIREAWLEPGAVFAAGRVAIKLVASDDIEVALSSRDRFADLYGASPAMREVFALLERVANTPMDVLLGGETGTGKELAAHGLHAHSQRRDGPFVVLDCSALPRELAEAAILGHVKGAFTGAATDRAGCFEEAHGGTLFLDEVGELPIELQPKLLRVLDRREVQRVGESRARPIDVRVVAATHRDLRKMVGDSTFREDLYFRLSEMPIDLPPLREREADVVLIAERFLATFAEERGEALQLGEDAKAALREHAWPGNVRELRKAIRRAAYLSNAAIVHRHDLALGGRHASPGASDFDDGFSLPLADAREVFDREYLTRLLASTGGNLSEAARRSGFSRQGLRDLLRRLGLYTAE